MPPLTVAHVRARMAAMTPQNDESHSPAAPVTQAAPICNAVYLNLRWLELTDICALHLFTHLRVLCIGNNRLTSFSGIAACTQLCELYAQGNQLTSVHELVHLISLRHLQVLWLYDNPWDLDGFSAQFRCLLQATARTSYSAAFYYSYWVKCWLPQVQRLDGKSIHQYQHGQNAAPDLSGRKQLNDTLPAHSRLRLDTVTCHSIVCSVSETKSQTTRCQTLSSMHKVQLHRSRHTELQQMVTTPQEASPTPQRSVASPPTTTVMKCAVPKKLAPTGIGRTDNRNVLLAISALSRDLNHEELGKARRIICKRIQSHPG
ncbi:hypothetical protein H4R34_001699 [Dimargaris verticillata]|uniref:Uncharacterized protein n=1 Tax=Dimargaris verticillata TaxID=2761393 RepID=A0A9W8EEQ9_9FUNG|nr:hypothetical protein H4R34_001699 [Dimargaris verticillata]